MILNHLSSDKLTFRNIYNAVHVAGKLVAPRGQNVLEVENFHYELPPYTRFANFVPRKLNIDYIKREFLWYLRGDPYDLSICDHAKIWNGIIHRGRLNSNYGLYVFRKGGFDWIIDELVRDKDSRRACITILDHLHLEPSTKDVPCTAYLNFRIRDNKLNMSVHMRSQDAVFGMGNDAPAFSFIHEMLMVKLRDTYPDLELGVYHHSADSFHVYERHFKLLKTIVEGPNIEFADVYCPRISSSEEVDFLMTGLWEGKEPNPNFAFAAWLLDCKGSTK